MDYATFIEAFTVGVSKFPNAGAVISGSQYPDSGAAWDGGDGPGYSYIVMNAEGDTVGHFDIVHDINTTGRFDLTQYTGHGPAHGITYMATICDISRDVVGVAAPEFYAHDTFVRSNGRYLGGRDFMILFGLDPNKHLPDGRMDYLEVGTEDHGCTLWIEPKNEPSTVLDRFGRKTQARRYHRIIAKCHECGRIMSAGRIAQHSCEAKSRNQQSGESLEAEGITNFAEYRA